MLVYFIRHGQTDWNAQRRFQGSQDIPLNEAGCAQAREIASRFENTKFSRIYHSPLKRAEKTAQILSEYSPRRFRVCRNFVRFAWGFGKA